MTMSVLYTKPLWKFPVASNAGSKVTGSLSDELGADSAETKAQQRSITAQL